MTERESWLKTLRENPADWGLRAVFSDWLRDHGEEELADGYAAIARFRLERAVSSGFMHADPQWHRRHPDQQGMRNAVTTDWFHVVNTGSRDNLFIWDEESFARAWSLLTPAQRAEAEYVLTPREVGVVA